MASFSREWMVLSIWEQENLHLPWPAVAENPCLWPNNPPVTKPTTQPGFLMCPESQTASERRCLGTVGISLSQKDAGCTPRMPNGEHGVGVVRHSWLISCSNQAKTNPGNNSLLRFCSYLFSPENTWVPAVSGFLMQHPVYEGFTRTQHLFRSYHSLLGSDFSYVHLSTCRYFTYLLFQ